MRAFKGVCLEATAALLLAPGVAHTGSVSGYKFVKNMPRV